MSALEPNKPVAAQPSESLEALWAAANAHAASGRFAESLPLYRKLADALPEVADVHCNLGAVLNALGQPGEAMAALRRALAADPMHALAQRNLAGLLEAAGAYDEAVEHYQEAAFIEPESLDAVRGLGCALNLAGRPDEARDVLQRALTLAPQDAQTHFYLGNCLAQSGEHELAVRHLDTAYRLTGDVRAGGNLANALIETGAAGQAEAVLRQVLAADGGYAPAWNGLGGVLLKQERLAEAHQALTRAVELAPDFAEAMHGLARCLFRMGDLEGALRRFEAVAALRPNDTAARTDAARALQHLGRFEDAEPWFRAILALDPDNARGWYDLAITLRRLDRLDEARSAVERALQLSPGFAKALILSADLYALADDRQAYSRIARKAADAAKGDAEALNAVGGLFQKWKDEDLALAAFRETLALRPDDAFASSRVFDLSLSACDWQTYAQDSQAQIAAVQRALADDSVRRGIDVFNLQALPVDYAFIARAARHASAAIAREAREHAPVAAFTHAARPRQRLRIGYALAYTYFHSLPMVLKEVIERHDRDRFEIFGYSLDRCDGGEFSQAYRAAFDHFADLPATAPYGAAERIQRDGIDVLIDTTGLTGQTCMPLMSFRPAPVQMHAFGYSITTGADYIDYLVTDRHYIPPEWEALGSEALIYLPDTFMPTVRPAVQAGDVSRSAHGLPDDAVVFCNFNHPCKFEPTVFDAWMRILRAVPGSVLWLGSWMQNTQRNLRREAEARGVDGERLIFASIVEHDRHLRRLALADIALDNYYHGGGVTSLDVLWAGVPLISATGIAPGGRLGATLSHAMGMPELVCRDLEEYGERAVALASDPAAREALRQKLLRQRDCAPLFDTDRFTRNLERGIAAAWDNHLSGQAPRRIDLAEDVPAA